MPSSNHKNDYKNIYNSFIRSLAHTQIGSIVSTEAFSDFPHHLPEKLRQPLSQRFEELAKLSEQFRVREHILTYMSKEEAVELLEGEIALAEKIKIRPLLTEQGDKFTITLPKGDKLLEYALVLMLSSDRDKVLEAGYQPFNIPKQFFLYQALSMSLAHLDAFLSDTVRMMCIARPEVLRSSEKSISWKTVLNFSNLQDAITYFCEEIAVDFSFKPTKERFKVLNNQYGLKLNISEAEKELEEFEQKRHVIIHNGGLIDSQYVKRTNCDSSEIGKPLAISQEDMDRLFHLLGTIGFSVFESAAIKYFDISDEEISKLITF